jgi:sugar lactone lactonase YvrE
MTIAIEYLLECGNHLGEGPLWDLEEGCLYWVDGTGRRVGNPAIWRWRPRTGKVDHWSLDSDVGALALRRNGALADGFYFFDFFSGRIELIQQVDADQPRTRLNDGKCDRRGRFFAGGMDDKEELKICGLWRLDPDLRVTKVDEGIICTNGPCWSPDDKTFYLADTFQGEYWAYDYDIANGTLANKRVVASFRDDPGVADGSTVDEEGCLWNAHFLDRRLLLPPLFIQSVFGIRGGIGPHPEDILHMKRTVDRLFGGAYQWSVVGAGRHQMAVAVQSAVFGGHVRVGLEDSLWIGKGQLATSNDQQVAKIRRILVELGLDVATPEEARQMLELKGRHHVRF